MWICVYHYPCLMKYILIGIFSLILLAGILLLFKDYYVKRKLRKLIAKKYIAVKPLLKKFSAKEPVSRHEVLEMSKDPSLRLAVFWILNAYSKIELFPDEYLTCEKGAESFMVSWLEFPTELGAAPDNIELVTKVTIKDTETLDYYVFKFNVDPPHWAADEWMIGICGPYTKQTLPYALPARVFSRFNLYTSVTPESETQWVHENISKENTMRNLNHTIALMY
jgi:hypothetical protein